MTTLEQYLKTKCTKCGCYRRRYCKVCRRSVCGWCDPHKTVSPWLVAVLCAVLVACSGDGNTLQPAADAGTDSGSHSVGNIVSLPAPEDAGQVVELLAQDAGEVLDADQQLDAGPPRAQDAGQDAGPAGCPEFEALTCEGIFGNGIRCADCDGQQRCVCGYVLTTNPLCAILCER